MRLYHFQSSCVGIFFDQHLLYLLIWYSKWLCILIPHRFQSVLSFIMCFLIDCSCSSQKQANNIGLHFSYFTDQLALCFFFHNFKLGSSAFCTFWHQQVRYRVHFNNYMYKGGLIWGYMHGLFLKLGESQVFSLNFKVLFSYRVVFVYFSAGWWKSRGWWHIRFSAKNDNQLPSQHSCLKASWCPLTLWNCCLLSQDLQLFRITVLDNNFAFFPVTFDFTVVFESSDSLAEWLWSNAVSTRNITPAVQEVNILLCTIWDPSAHRYSEREVEFCTDKPAPSLDLA